MSKRRGNQEGTIAQRKDGRWEARMSFPDGKRKCFYGKTRQEVQKKLDQAKRDIHSGMTLGDGHQSVEHYLLSWLDAVKAHLKVTTHQRYCTLMRLHALPTFGKVPLLKLTPQHLQSLYSTKLANGLAVTTVRTLHIILHGAFADAVRLGLIPRNISDMVRPPRKTHPEMHVFDEQQSTQFIEAAQKHKMFGALFVVAITTGMRIGEITALRWKDVDLGKGTLQVQQSTIRVSGILSFAEPKTKSSRRTIRLTKIAINMLQNQRLAHLKQLSEQGPNWNVQDLVFTRCSGETIDFAHFGQDHFQPFIKRIGLPRIRFHDLRHTAATLLLSKGVNVKVVSEMLGHSNITVTLQIYGHVLPDMQQAAVEAMDNLFSET